MRPGTPYQVKGHTMNTKHLENKLTVALEAARVGPPKASIEAALNVYAMAKSEQERFESVAAQAKKIIEEVMEETRCFDFDVPSGRAMITSATTSTRYDTKAIDALIASDDGLARVLEPHRISTTRNGSLRVTLKKGD